MSARISGKLKAIRQRWKGVKSSSRFHSLLLYLSFVGIAALFWLIMALNDSVTKTFDVGIKVVNVPDTVTFINDPPSNFHVTVRDRGTNMMRSAVVVRPQLELNFRDYATKGVFRFTKADLNSMLKSAFGSAAQIASTSIDSLYLHYTANKGKRVPVVVRADITASPGNVISGRPTALEKAVMVYSYSDNLDTITRVFTEPLFRRNLKETSEIEVALTPIASAKIVPSKVKVRIPVEPLVKKESVATVHTVNVPPGESLLLFPTRVPVEYYVPMSLFSSDLVPVEVSVDYKDINRTPGNRIPVSLHRVEDYVVSPVVLSDSVEYTLVKG